MSTRTTYPSKIWFRIQKLVFNEVKLCTILWCLFLMSMLGNCIQMAYILCSSAIKSQHLTITVLLSVSISKYLPVFMYSVENREISSVLKFWGYALFPKGGNQAIYLLTCTWCHSCWINWVPCTFKNIQLSGRFHF